MRTFLAAVAALCVFASPAFAQSGVDLNPVIRDVVAPLAVTVLSGVASVILGLGYSWLSRKWGVDIEAKHREALHSALVTGINLAIAKTGGMVGKLPSVPVSNPLSKMALEYALRSVPDAVKHFDLTPEKVEQMILAKLPQVTGQTAPSVSPPVST